MIDDINSLLGRGLMFRSRSDGLFSVLDCLPKGGRKFPVMISYDLVLNVSVGD